MNEPNTIMRLTDMHPGDSGLVRHLEGGHNFISRLATMGFTPGVRVTIVRNNERGPLLVRVRGSQVALGLGEARQIQLVREEFVPLPEVEEEIAETKKRVIALAGQPNVGKTTVFNILTGMNQHVGNWPGKTVEQKTGYFQADGVDFKVIDLPGTYSLTSSSDEERISRDFIIHEKPDLVVMVVDAAGLERNLYLLAELLLLPAPIVLALNMMDVAQQEGIQVEPRVLESALGLPVVPMSAGKGQGVKELVDTINRLLDGEINYHPVRPYILPAHETILIQVINDISASIKDEVDYPANWMALKLLEGDSQVISIIKEHLPPNEWGKVEKVLYEHEDAILDIAGARYEWIARMVRAAVINPPVTRGSLTARLDQVLTHPVWGVVMLLGILGSVFWATYAIGGPIQIWLGDRVTDLADLLRAGLVSSPGWLVEALAGGVLGGVGMVITFLPILVIFYFFLGMLEETGYLARIAYLTDRWMHRMGLHGKSFLPLLLGFGCNVPAVLGTRIIESKRAKLLTILLIPLIPCTARLAVVAFLAPLFFGQYAAWAAVLLIIGNIILLAVSGFIMHTVFFKNEHVPFIMELPLYHNPNLKNILIYVWQNVVGFLQKAGTVILAASLVVWGLSYFPNGNVLTSYISEVGRWFEPLANLMGLPWQVMMALLTSIVAKENTIATLGVLYGNLNEVLPALITLPAAAALLVFQMLFIPCIGTITAIRAETKSTWITLLSALMMFVISFGAGILVFQIGSIILLR
ncbi:MAG: ferrous iron transport protein B [Anaerolineaceae bacterium]